MSVGGKLLSVLRATNSLTEQKQEDPDDPEPAGEGDIQMEYCDQLYSPNIGAVTKNCPQELRSEQVPSDNTKYLIVWDLCESE